jgi:hypothetical protein
MALSMKRAIPQHIMEVRIEVLRRQMTQRELSAKSKVGESDLSRILNGWLDHPAKLMKIRKALGLDGKAVAV